MMSEQCAANWAWVVLLALAVAAAALTLALLLRPVRRMLSVNSVLSQARAFYVRAMALVLLLAALAAAVGAGRLAKPEQGCRASMEYVWWVVDNLKNVFWSVALLLLGFVAALTILYSALGRHRD